MQNSHDRGRSPYVDEGALRPSLVRRFRDPRTHMPAIPSPNVRFEDEVGMSRMPNRHPGSDSAQYLYENTYADAPSPMLGHTPSTPSLSVSSSSRRSSVSRPFGDQFHELLDTCKDLQSQIDELKSENGTLKAAIENMQDTVRKLGDRATGTADPSKATKSIANQHKKAKVHTDPDTDLRLSHT
jgi:hypothetical protein